MRWNRTVGQNASREQVADCVRAANASERETLLLALHVNHQVDDAVAVAILIVVPGEKH